MRLFILFLLLIAGHSLAIEPFEDYEPKKIDVGYLYTYQFQNDLNRIYYYYKSEKDIQQINTNKKNGKDEKLNVFISNEFDWSKMMLNSSTFQTNTEKVAFKQFRATFRSLEQYNFQKKKLEINGTNWEKLSTGYEGFYDYKYESKIENVPTYSYDGDMLHSLWMALRFYPKNKEEVELNLLHHGENFNIKVAYQGIEPIVSKLGPKKCHKYELSVDAGFFWNLFNKTEKAYLWLNAEDSYEYMVRYFNKNPRNSFEPTVSMELLDRKKIDNNTWEKLLRDLGGKEEHIKEFK